MPGEFVRLGATRVRSWSCPSVHSRPCSQHTDPFLVASSPSQSTLHLPWTNIVVPPLISDVFSIPPDSIAAFTRFAPHQNIPHCCRSKSTTQSTLRSGLLWTTIRHITQPGPGTRRRRRTTPRTNDDEEEQQQQQRQQQQQQ